MICYILYYILNTHIRVTSRYYTQKRQKNKQNLLRMLDSQDSRHILLLSVDCYSLTMYPLCEEDLLVFAGHWHRIHKFNLRDI